MCVPQVVLTSYSYHFPNVMMLAQVVVTSVILEGGRLLGFSSMLKYTLERYYFASERGRLPVYIFGWWCTNEATFRLFLLFAFQRRECPTEGLILFILVSFTAAQASVMQYSPSPRSCYLLHENESCTLIGCSLGKECVCRFEPVAWGLGALCDSGPSRCEGGSFILALSSKYL